MSTPSLSVRAAALAALLFALPPRAAAEEAKSAGDLTDAERERAVKEVMVRVDAAYQAALAAHAGETDRWFVARGVVADKSERTVRVDAFSTGLPPGSILEFLLITLNSGHDYEATFQTTALAADLARAFAFIGLPTGRPVAPGSFRFWPAGERVLATASVDGAAPIPLDAFAADAQTKAPLPETGFLYVGGAWKEDGTLTVDSAGPGSIVPTYNEPVTLFDLPRRAPQGTVYESITASTNSPAKPFLPVAIEFRPEPRPEGAPRRVRDLALRIVAPRTYSVDGAAETLDASALVLRLQEIRKAGQDPYVSFSWDGAVPCGDLREAAQLLQMLDADSGAGIRVVEPPAGFPFYQAFLPRDEWRDRARRFSQPCELRLSLDESGAASAVLDVITETWPDEALKPDLSVEEIPGVTPEALPGLLRAKAIPDLKAILVFVPSALKWSDLAPFLAACADTHPLVQIFVD